MRLGALVHRARRALRTARMAFRRRGVILLYHRIASPPADPLLLCVSPEHFEQHLAVLRRDFAPIGLEALAAALTAGRIPDRAVAITFDDGYADNLLEAAPRLARFGQGATVFVAGDCLEGKPFFYDELEQILLGAPRLPRVVRLVVDGRAHEWDLGIWSRRTKTPGPEYANWNLEWTSDPTPRHRCYREAFNLLRGATAGDRRRALSALRRAADVESAPARLWMTKAELRAAADGGTLTLGAHTRSHPVLTRLTLDGQREEILAGKQMLERAIARPVRAFAYPYGSPWDVSAGTVRLAREAGFSLACANTPGPVDSESDPHWLARCLVRDWDGEEFARRLRQFFRPRADIPPQG